VPLFFAFAFVWTWCLQVLAAHVGGAAELPLVALAAFGPTLAAVVLTRAAAQPLGSLWRGGGGRWHLVALAWPTTLCLTAALLGGHVALSPPNLAAAIGPPLGEEPGWRGFALPRLTRRLGVVRANLVVGAAWAAWHLPSSLLGGSSASAFALFALSVMASSWIIGWLWERSGGSVTVAIAAHAGLNLGVVAAPRWTLALLALLAVAAAVDLHRRAGRPGAPCRAPG